MTNVKEAFLDLRRCFPTELLSNAGVVDVVVEELVALVVVARKGPGDSGEVLDAVSGRSEGGDTSCQ